MPVHLLGTELVFPPASDAEPDGLLAVGGDVSPARLRLAYENGIFPWYAKGEPILWFSPDPRMVLEPSGLHVPRSLARRLRQRTYRVTIDAAFGEVIRGCQAAPRPGQDGTWITDDLIRGFEGLHAEGVAHSVEAWFGEELSGGLYGLAVGGVFCGESMFARRRDASKVAFVTLVLSLRRWGFTLVDCQLPTDHLARFGAVPWARSRFLYHLRSAVRSPVAAGAWGRREG